MIDKRKLRERIAALKAKTTDNGCTEAEAMTAAEKVAELLSSHGVEDPMELEFDQYSVEIGRRTVVSELWPHVALFCHCKLWYSRDWRRGKWSVVYFGRWHDVAVAEYLHGMLDRHMANATRDFKKTGEYTRRRKPKTRNDSVKAFQQALVNALSNKLWVIQWRRWPKVEGTDHAALILSPLDAVNKELDRRGMKFGKGLKPLKAAASGYDHAGDHGRRAAQSIDINAAVTGHGTTAVSGLLPHS